MRRILRGQVFKVLLFILCFGLSFYFKAHAQVSGTYTINSALATGGTNFHSFADAVAYMQSGLNGPIVFNVSGGPYNEQVYLNYKIGTTATNTLTINGNGATLTFLSTDPNQRAGIKLDNISYVTINNLKVVPQGSDVGQYGYGFHLLNNSDNNTIKNCTITCTMNLNDNVNNNEGIVINGNNGYSTDPGTSNCDNNLIQGNTISGGGNGISLNSQPVAGPATLMQGNKILNNTISNCFNNLIQLAYTDGTVVDGNDLQGGLDIDLSTSVTGVFLNLVDQNVKVTNNKIHNIAIADQGVPTGIFGVQNSAMGTAGTVNLIANNAIYNFRSKYLQYGIAVPSSASYFNVYHNCISLDDQTQTGGKSEGLFFQQINDANIWNNIVSATRKATGGYNRGITFNITTRVTCDRNVYYINGATGVNSTGKYKAAAIVLLSDWQKQTGFDYHSVSVNPQYTSTTTNLLPASQAIDNLGIYQNINTDITGAGRSTVNPDPGCYEFTSAACSTAMTAGTLNVLPDSVFCVGPTITLGLTNGTRGAGETYTWQSSSSLTGTYTNIGSSVPYPFLDQTPAATTYYRLAMTCSGTTVTTNPLRVIVNTQLPAGTYTINSTLPTGGINFHSFNDAILAMGCGIGGSIVFNVAPNTGPYNEQVILPALPTSPGKTITFNGNGDTLAFAPIASSAEKAVFKLNGSDYITIDSLTVNVTGATAGYGIQLLNDADNNTIKRCRILANAASGSTDFAGIVISSDPKLITTTGSTAPSGDSNTIANNTIVGGTYGILLVSGSAVRAFGNTIFNNTLKDQYYYGIYMDGGMVNVLIDSNDISMPNRKVVYNYSGIYIDQHTDASSLLKISRNKIHNLLRSRQDTIAEMHGIDIDRITTNAATPIVVSNNLLYDFHGIGQQFGLYTIGSSNVKFYHNTVSLEDSVAKVVDPAVKAVGFGSFYTGASTSSVGVEFKNNSVLIKRGGSGISAGVYINANDNALVSNNNNFLLQAPGGGTQYVGYLNGATYTSLSNWLAVGKDSNSISLDPLYRDPANADFTPTYIPFDNKGTPVGVPIDIIDVTRSVTKPDIGAYEFTICYPLNTPVLTLDSVGVYTIRFAWTPVPNTTGYLVSRDGVNWSLPSSGPMGTTHTVAGLKARDTVGLMVKALGTRWDCPPAYSNRVTGQTVTDQIFIPNTFTPNGNGQNDVFRVYSNIIQSMHLMVFNQWGEKVFETNDINGGWDGTYKGKPQPVGVYVYVAYMVLSDSNNSTVTKKGTFNLVR